MEGVPVNTRPTEKPYFMEVPEESGSKRNLGWEIQLPAIDKLSGKEVVPFH